MWSFDSAQISDLVGMYILDTHGNFLDLRNVRICRGDGLISIPNINGPLTSEIQKKVIRVFKYKGLKIEISSNLKIVNLLDVTLNLNDNSYKPFSKPNAIRTYINVSSNHLASIVEQIPNAINIRINRLSYSKNIFNNLKEFFNEALHNSGYKNKVMYLEAKRHHKNSGNNIGNNGHKNRGNNIGNNGTNNNKYMDNKLSKNIDKNRLSKINIGKYFFRLNKQTF